MRISAVALGLGALVEELFFASRIGELIPPYRRLHEVRRRMLQEVEEKAGEDVAEAVSNVAAAIKRYASEVEEALAGLGADPVKASLESAVEEYAEVLRLDVPVGGGKTLEDLLYEGRDEVLDKLHEIMMALFMEYVEINETCDRGLPAGGGAEAGKTSDAGASHVRNLQAVPKTEISTRKPPLLHLTK